MEDGKLAIQLRNGRVMTRRTKPYVLDLDKKKFYLLKTLCVDEHGIWATRSAVRAALKKSKTDVAAAWLVSGLGYECLVSYKNNYIGCHDFSRKAMQEICRWAGVE